MKRLMLNEFYKLISRRKVHALMIILLIFSLFTLGSELLTNSLFKPYTSGNTAAVGNQLLPLKEMFNGQSFPSALLDGATNIIFPIFVIILIASLITEEYSDGSLKLPLLRQISRSQLLKGKLASLTMILALFLLILMLFGYIFGTVFLGWGSKFLIMGKTISSYQGLLFTLSTYIFSLVSLVFFGMIMLFFAVVLDNSGSVVGIGAGILFMLLVIEQMFPEVSPYLISHYFNTYELFISGMNIKKIAIGYLIVSIYCIGFYTLGVFIFKKKDLLI